MSNDTELYLSTILNAGFVSNLSSFSGMYNFIQKLQTRANQLYWITSKWAKSPRGNGIQKSDSIKRFPFFLKAVYATACKTKIWRVSSKNKNFKHDAGLELTRKKKWNLPQLVLDFINAFS